MLTNTSFGDGGIWDVRGRDSVGSDTLNFFFSLGKKEEK